MANNYYNFTNSFVPGTKVRSDDMNNELDGITAGFNKLPDDPESINRGTTYVGTESGSANAYVVARDNPQTSYQNEDHVGFFATHDNTSSGTIDVDGLGVVALVAPDGSALVASDITDGIYYEAVFDTTNNRWQLITPLAGTLTEADKRVSWAEEWAINPEDSLISTAAGGNGTTDYSSLHWAAKASDSADASAVSAAAAAASFDEFDDIYLGSKAADPTLDNDNDALQTGALYWNTTSNEMRVWNGSAWENLNVDSYTKAESDAKYAVISLRAICTGANAGSSISAGATSYLPGDVSGYSFDALESNQEIFICPMTGTLQDLFAQFGTNSTTSASTVTIRVNGADTAVVATIPAGSTAMVNSGGLTDTVTKGDLVTIKVVNGGGGVLGLTFKFSFGIA